MSIRVMVYAEGPGEDRGPVSFLPAPGEALADTMLGPAHHLVGRLISREQSPPAASVQFLSPLHVGSGRPHRGSDLVTKRVLRRLLTIADPRRRPDLAIVLVDEDGQSERRRDLVAALVGIELPHVLAIPIREFEAWLISDPRALVDVLGVTETPPAAEAMKPRQAKDLLRSWIDARMDASLGQTDRGAHIEQIRSSLAQKVDLEALAKLKAFKEFRDHVRAVLRTLPTP